MGRLGGIRTYDRTLLPLGLRLLGGVRLLRRALDLHLRVEAFILEVGEVSTLIALSVTTKLKCTSAKVSNRNPKCPLVLCCVRGGHP